MVLCSLTKWKGSFLQVQTEKKTKVALSPAGRTQDIGLSKGLCIAVAKKKKKNQYFKLLRPGERRRNMATHFILGS